MRWGQCVPEKEEKEVKKKIQVNPGRVEVSGKSKELDVNMGEIEKITLKLILHKAPQAPQFKSNCVA